MQFVVPLFLVAVILGCGVEQDGGWVSNVAQKSGEVGVSNVLSNCSDNPSPFITRWQVGAGDTIVLPIHQNAPAGYDFTVNWGDGSSPTNHTKSKNFPVQHSYNKGGNYTISITGRVGRAWTYGKGGSASTASGAKLIRVNDLGSVGWRKLRDAFSGLPNLRQVSGGCTSEVYDMAYMFANSPKVIPSTSTYDTSGVYSLEGMFQSAESAKPNTSNWDTSRVTNMRSTFSGAISAQPNVSNWDTSRVTEMSNMFRYTRYGQLDTSDWDVSQVKYMSGLFQNSYADPDVSNWNTAKVMYVSRMFTQAHYCNPDVNGWNTGKVTDVSEMFMHTTYANPDVSNWNTSKMTNMQNIFYNAARSNPDFSDWDFSRALHVRSMFSDKNNLSTQNYSTLLKRLADSPEDGGLLDKVKGVPLYVGNVRYYSDAAPARTHLIDMHGFNIGDGGEVQ